MSGVGNTPDPATCETCGKPAKERVVLISRRNGAVLSDKPACVEHVQAELRLAAEGLSMVDLELKPLDGAR